MSKIALKKTARGFPIGQFTDYYGRECSIQQSSLVEPDCIWLGINDAAPHIMARDAIRLGIPTTETCGWVPYPVPEQVQFHTRMHLTREMAKAMLPILTRFVKKGRIDP